MKYGVEHFRPAPNLDATFFKMESNVYYRSYRQGDVLLEYWWADLRYRIAQIKRFLSYERYCR